MTGEALLERSPLRTDWPMLRSGFLDAKQPQERAAILRKAEDLIPRLAAWAGGYASVREVRLRPVALTVAAAAPFASLDALAVTAQVTLWIFAIDDLFDEELVPYTDLLQAAESFRSAAWTGQATQADEVSLCLLDIRRRLARLPWFDRFAGDWAFALCRTIDGMIREYEWRMAYAADGSLPSYDDYVANGLYSIGGPPYLWTALLASTDPSLPDCMPRLRAMEPVASTCVRLANDLRSHEKELAEGKLNAVTIQTRAFEAQGFSAVEAHRLAEASIRADMLQRLARLELLRREVRSATGQPEANMVEIALFACDFYVSHDFNGFEA